MKALVSHIRRFPGLKLGGSIGGLVAIQLIAAFSVQIVVLRVVGAGRDTDAFIAAQTIPLLTASIVGTALQNIWQPRLAIAAQADWRADMERALAMACLLILPLTLILVFLSPLLVRWLFVGFAPAQLNLTVTLTRISLIGMVFNMLTLILAAGGRAVGRFVMMELIPTALSVLGLVGIGLVVPRAGVNGAVWILSLRAVGTFLLLWVVLGMPIPRNPHDERFGATARGVFALMGGSSFYKLGPLVDRYWGSQAPSGQLTLYNLAQSGMGAVATLLERAISLPIVPDLSRSVHAADYASVRRTYRHALLRIWATVLICGVAGGIISMTAKPLVVMLLHVTPMQVTFLEMLGFAFLGFLGVAAGGAVINSTFYAMGDVKTPITVGTLGFLFSLVVKTLAFLSNGLVTMAAATSLYYIATMFVMITFLERRLNKYASA